MVHVYLDSSAWVKRYYTEMGSNVTELCFDRLLRPRPSRLTSLQLGMPEVISVLNRHRNAGRLSQSTFNTAYSYLAADSRLIKLLPVRNYQVDLSIRLLLKHNLNATDALHLQVALDLYARFQQERHKLLLLCADQRLLRAAQSEGLPVLNPEANTMAQAEALLT